MKILILLSSLLLSTSVIADSGQLKLELIQAKRGDITAQFRVASAYEFGTDIKKDLTKAMFWYLKAAAKSHAHAQYKIGYLYENGLGVPANINTAMEWYRKAKINGNKLAIKRLRKKSVKVKAVAVKKTAPPKKPVKVAAAKPKKVAAVKKPAKAKKAPTKASKKSFPNILKIVLNSKWKNKNGSSDYLPSDSTTCLNPGNSELTCFSNEKVRKVKSSTVKYSAKSTISKFKSNGSFNVTYNYNGLEVSGGSSKASDIYGLKAAEGWQKPPIRVKCQANSKKSITCTYGKKKVTFYK